MVVHFRMIFSFLPSVGGSGAKLPHTQEVAAQDSILVPHSLEFDMDD